MARLAELPEGSGLAASRRTPGRLWAHNDSGEPVLYALNSAGAVTGKLRLSGAAVEDWEAVGVGACPAGSCLYVADIGDNDAERRRITVYRVPEPTGELGTAGAEPLYGIYPDGPHDAEALLITPDGRLHLVTKGDTGPVAIYRFPAALSAGSTSQLERVGPPRGSRKPAANDRITDGAISLDGAWAVLRSKDALTFYLARSLFAGDWRPVGAVDLTSFGEPQGEGVTFGPGSEVFLVGEGGGKSQPGTFARLACTLTARSPGASP